MQEKIHILENVRINYDEDSTVRNKILGTTYKPYGYLELKHPAQEDLGNYIVNYTAPDDESIGLNNIANREVGYVATQAVIHSVYSSNLSTESTDQLVHHINHLSRLPIEVPFDKGDGIYVEMMEKGKLAIAAHPELLDILHPLTGSALLEGIDCNPEYVYGCGGIMANNIDAVWNLMLKDQQKCFDGEVSTFKQKMNDLLTHPARFEAALKDTL